MLEEWRAVRGYPGLYEVSSLGRVRSLSREVIYLSRLGYTYRWLKGRILIPVMHKRNGYYTVTLHGSDKVGRYHFIHRLVLEAFVGPCPRGMECRHFPDPSHKNNRADNLSWCTPEQNRADKEVHGTIVASLQTIYERLTRC